MPESSIEPSLVSRLLLDRDAEYRRANAAEQLVEELSDARVLKEKYERLISEKKRDIEEKRRIIEEKNEYILRLEQKLLFSQVPPVPQRHTPVPIRESQTRPHRHRLYLSLFLPRFRPQQH